MFFVCFAYNIIHVNLFCVNCYFLDVVRLGVLFRRHICDGFRDRVRCRPGIHTLVPGVRTVQLVRQTFGHQHSRRSQLDG